MIVSLQRYRSYIYVLTIQLETQVAADVLEPQLGRFGPRDHRVGPAAEGSLLIGLLCREYETDIAVVVYLCIRAVRINRIYHPAKIIARNRTVGTIANT